MDKKKTSLYINSDLLDKMKIQAIKEKITQNEIIIKAIKRYIEYAAAEE